MEKLCFSPYVHTKLKVTVVVEKVVDEGVTKKLGLVGILQLRGENVV